MYADIRVADRVRILCVWRPAGRLPGRLKAVGLPRKMWQRFSVSIHQLRDWTVHHTEFQGRSEARSFGRVPVPRLYATCPKDLPQRFRLFFFLALQYSVYWFYSIASFQDSKIADETGRLKRCQSISWSVSLVRLDASVLKRLVPSSAYKNRTLCAGRSIMTTIPELAACQTWIGIPLPTPRHSDRLPATVTTTKATAQQVCFDTLFPVPHSSSTKGMDVIAPCDSESLLGGLVANRRWKENQLRTLKDVGLQFVECMTLCHGVYFRGCKDHGTSLISLKVIEFLEGA